MGRSKEITEFINEVIFGRDQGLSDYCVCPECGHESNYKSPVACSSQSCTICGCSTMTHPDNTDLDQDGQSGEGSDDAPTDFSDFDTPVGSQDHVVHKDDFLPTMGRPTGQYYRESSVRDESEQIALNNIGWGLGTGLSRADTPFNRFGVAGPAKRKMLFTGPKALELKLAQMSATHETPPVGTPGSAPIGYVGTNGPGSSEQCVCDNCGYSMTNDTGKCCDEVPCPKCGAL